MIPLDRIEAHAAAVKAEADRLLEVAREQFRRFDLAHGNPAEPAIAYTTTREVATIARQLTRAQAVLVHTSDPRHGAAVAVIGYCDDADLDAAGPSLEVVR